MTTLQTNTSSRHRRWGRRLLWTVLVLATLIPLYYAFVNWRGAKAWQEAKSAYEAAGETVDWKQLLAQDKIPDAENFFATPLLNGLSDPADKDAAALRKRLEGPRSNQGRGTRGTRPLRLNGMSPEDRKRLGGFRHGRPTDYEAWREIAQENGLVMPAAEPDAARAILIGIEDAIDWFAEIDEASNRHQSQILPLVSEQLNPAQPWTLARPHISACRSAALWLHYRAKAATGCQQTDTVSASLAGIFRIIHGMKNEPTLLSLLVANGLTTTLIHPLWESLHVHLWDDVELQIWDRELKQLQPIQAHRESLRTEATHMISYLDYVKRASWKDANVMMGLNVTKSNRIASLQLILIPDGHLDRAKADRLTEFLRLQKTLGSTNLHPAKQLMETFAAEAQADASNPFREFGDLSSFSDILISATTVITQVRQARIAIALERYYLVHQRYPEVLGELTPAFIDVLPEDPMGEAWQYKPTPQHDTFLLYSLGWNQVDDGGVSPALRKRETGDIVWIR